jgi:hypothetical protein
MCIQSSRIESMYGRIASRFAAFRFAARAAFAFLSRSAIASGPATAIHRSARLR